MQFAKSDSFAQKVYYELFYKQKQFNYKLATKLLMHFGKEKYNLFKTLKIPYVVIKRKLFLFFEIKRITKKNFHHNFQFLQPICNNSQ